MTKSYEKPTDELRQVRHEVKHWTGRIGAPTGHEIKYVYYTVQRKWLVQDGPAYVAEYAKNMFTDIQIGLNEYCPSKEEWRDLPTVGDVTSMAVAH